MNAFSKVSLFGLVAIVIGASSAGNTESRTLPSLASPASLAAEGACPIDDAGSELAMSAMCNYLAKCCGGNTDNAQKCCTAYFQKC